MPPLRNCSQFNFPTRVVLTTLFKTLSWLPCVPLFSYLALFSVVSLSLSLCIFPFHSLSLLFWSIWKYVTNITFRYQHEFPRSKNILLHNQNAVNILQKLNINILISSDNQSILKCALLFVFLLSNVFQCSGLKNVFPKFKCKD